MRKFKKTLYPKTQRFNDNLSYWQITEKLDGSNLTLFKYGGELWIGTRNYVFCYEDVESKSDIGYDGLYGWLKEHADDIKNFLEEEEAICGEWIGMGKIKYRDALKHKFYVFGRGKIVVDLEKDLFKLVAINRNVSCLEDWLYSTDVCEYMGVVPCVSELESVSNKHYTSVLDNLYERYVYKVRRYVEGFVITNLYTGQPFKYVRLKNGKLTQHEEGKYVQPVVW